jgi:hypothetical protein
MEELDLRTLTWQTLTRTGALAAWVGILVLVLKKPLGIVSDRAKLALVGGLSQLFAQAAFGISKGWSGPNVLDAALVGIAAALMATGAHQLLKKGLGNSRG